MKVFVYGTLKKGYGNNGRLRNATFVEEAIIPGIKLYYSWDRGGFPVAQKEETSRVKGEIWDISGKYQEETLRGLDALEGNGYMYNREEIQDGLWTYIGHPRNWRFNEMTECPVVEGNYQWDR